YRGDGGAENLDSSMESFATHDELNTVTLTTLITQLEPWEYPLNALEQLALSARARPSRKKDAKPDQRRRLMWELTTDEYGFIDLKAREQTANKRGGWSKGRAISLKRLRSDAPIMDFLIEQDRAAAAAIQEQRYGWGYGRQHNHFHAGEKSLYALVGHLLVVDNNGHALEIARRDPELIISEQPEGICAHIEPHGANHGDYLVVKSDATRVEVTRFSADHKRLFELIPAEGLHLPFEAKARLMKAVSALSRQIRIHSSVTGDHLTANQIVGAHEPWVQLVPAGMGLSITLRVEPVPESGVYVDPGKGGETLLVEHAGETIEAKRDHAAEIAAVDKLVDACQSLRRAYDERNFYQYADPADCLELLEELHAAKARCLWPQGERYRVVARADTSQLNLTIKPAAQWFTASGSLRVNEDKVLGLTELLALLEANPQSRFLEIDDGQFIALSVAFRRQLDELLGLSTPGKGKSVRFHRLAAPALEELVEQSNCDIGTAWRSLRTRLTEAHSFKPDLPSTLRAELRPYQLDGFHWLAQVSHWGVGACLADDMGLGKTVEALALLLHRASGGPALVVAPTSVVTNWVEEAQRFAPTLNVVTYTGTARTRVRLLSELAPLSVVVITYGLLQIDLERLADIEWHSVVLDEAQNIKNAATKRAQAARRLNAQFRLATTGTPIQNNLMDLHSLFSFLNPGLLGSAAQFRTRFQLPIERDGDAEVRSRLRRLISPFMLRRTKTEVLDDLPSRTEITLHVELSQPEATLYEALRRRAVQELEAGEKKSPAGSRHLQVLAHLTKLRLACCHPKLVHDSAEFGSAKLAVFAETLTELLENRHKVLVFSQFVMHLKIIEAHLEESGIHYHYLDGRTSVKTRAKRIAEFQNGEGDVFLISLKAGGTGLNLTAADYVIHMDPWWNPAVEDQASDRAHRIGQTRPVTIYRLVTTGTVEEQIVNLHHKKRDLADRLLEGADAPARLNASELLELIREPL
ncbi:MAG: DEAD/DEAH box helicase, partial [Gammaproteobacteria bacterium]|nr:DEAD/DEAH box helicase [Gammaproteobacteria bacterium]